MFNRIVPPRSNYGKIHTIVFDLYCLYRSCCSRLGVTVLTGDMAVVTIVFYSSFFVFSVVLTFNSLRSLSTVSNSFVVVSSHLFQVSHRILGLPRFLFTPFSGQLIYLLVFSLPFFPHDWFVSIYPSPISS